MRYNRRRLASLGVCVPPEHLAPAEIEILGATGDFPGWSLASPEDPLPLMGFEYAAEVALSNDEDWLDKEDLTTIEDPLEEVEHSQNIGDNYISELLEVSESTDIGGDVSSPDDVVDDRDLWDLFGNTNLKGRSIDQLLGECSIETTEDAPEKASLPEDNDTRKRCRQSTDPTRQPEDSDLELFGGLSGRTPRNVAKKRRLTSAPSNVSPSFNEQMESKWVDIFTLKSLKYSGKRLVNECLEDYQRYRASEMRRAAATSQGDDCPMLFSVSYARAEVWLKKQIQLMENPHERGLFDEGCQAREREVQAMLDHRTSSTAARLNLEVPQAKPVISKGVVDTGPQPVDGIQRLLERSQGSACVSSRYTCPYCGKPLTRGKNAHVFTARAWRYGECPEAPKDRTKRARSERVAAKPGMQDRRERAAERLRILGLTGNPDLGKQKRCTVCTMAWSKSDGDVAHSFIGRGQTFCPFGDPIEVLEGYKEEQRERKKATEKAKRERRRARKNELKNEENLN
ncbi:hypothetical protein Pmar_PMAR025702 [Perkinsus marinus ATCC 50983]|uniref:Uncharacterized protein n=1 Tax=Perkinsus marinus (strain ATCC 50983 / TXsc) TaxID=423536 RepID=C5K9E1_PERM5|nr:hypothetical protein Pmar_PMAR025702 [Perkinsus marinus ATCC 50983]EER18903.1 hypothetical protein Pmar_PMAR025702 [Perkinsus marinus ATCC 50983]|eukprot:XP_002787107.1 hypothetical protein Pmar_PMAR025702 [Perkinsus marinus ATCC 50983]